MNLQKLRIPIVIEFAIFLVKKYCYNKTIEYIPTCRGCTIMKYIGIHDAFSNAIGIYLTMPAFKAKEVVKILTKLGYLKKRQTGSHLIMYHPRLKRIIPVPMHAKDIKKGLLRGIIKQADSTEQEFLKLK